MRQIQIIHYSINIYDLQNQVILKILANIENITSTRENNQEVQHLLKRYPESTFESTETN